MTEMVVLLRLGERCLALSALAVRHIAALERIFPLPLLPAGWLGIMPFQDEMVPLLNPPLAEAEGGAVQGTGYKYVVICSTEAGLVGLPVSEVLQVVNRSEGTEIDADADSDLASAGVERYFVYRECRYGWLDVESQVVARFR